MDSNINLVLFNQNNTQEPTGDGFNCKNLPEVSMKLPTLEMIQDKFNFKLGV